MNEAGDKMATNRGATLPKGRRKKACPFLKVKAGSAVVPIYRTACKGRLRYTLSFYRDGRRMRKMFNDLESAKKEALFVAQRIQSGMPRNGSASCPRKVSGKTPSATTARSDA